MLLVMEPWQCCKQVDGWELVICKILMTACRLQRCVIVSMQPQKHCRIKKKWTQKRDALSLRVLRCGPVYGALFQTQPSPRSGQLFNICLFNTVSLHPPLGFFQRTFRRFPLVKLRLHQNPQNAAWLPTSGDIQREGHQKVFICLKYCRFSGVDNYWPCQKSGYLF